MHGVLILVRRIIYLNLFLVIPLCGQIKLPKLISDGMVLQRNTEIKIWGYASAGEKVTVSFLKKNYSDTADSEGNWNILLPKQKAGGPYEMQIKGGNSITIHDVMIGDVWLCSGQSNMELPMKRVSWNYPGEIENSENKFIRQFAVPQKYNFIHPEKDLSYGSMPSAQAGWKSASPENTPEFSAAAYFFAKEIYNKYKIPVGIINSSLGGSPVESWISEDALKKFPAYYNEARMYRDSVLILKIEEADRARSNAWYKLLDEEDRGLKSDGRWSEENYDAASWPSMKIPGYWADTELGFKNGVVWFRKKINVPESLAGKPAKLILGRIVDADSAFFNGKFVGNVTYQYPPRRYEIPVDLLKPGENTIAVRVVSNSGKGGFVPDKQYAILCGDTSISLDGDWKFRPGAEMPALAGQTFIRWKPMGLYNAMIAPLLNYKIKGAVWYQGESNAGRPWDYRDLFTAMIEDWRNKFNQGNFPFLYVQLPNFMEAKTEPSESGWALLREAQIQTLSVPNTGMAVAIDIGEWNDIHPLDKKDVGLRLFLSAEKVAYGDNAVICSGPLYKSMRIEGNKIILSFDSIGGGLIARDGELKEFAIAGSDRHFVWAKAKIINEEVIVWSEEIVNPVAVRYAWADNPASANLYNKAGLPASPFRTDNF